MVQGSAAFVYDNTLFGYTSPFAGERYRLQIAPVWGDLQFVEALELFQIGVSWGGYESLVVPIHVQPDGWSEPRWIVRLFCGLEEPEDLIADLKSALTLLS